MLVSLQRLFSSLSVILWFGGFTFYTAVVLRIGSKVIGGLRQGYITQRVTDILNYFAIAMAVGVLVDMVVRWQDARGVARYLRSVNWLVIVAMTVYSIMLHHQMDGLLDPSTFADPDDTLFVPLHQRYQMVNTFIWVAALIEVSILVGPVTAGRGTGKPAPTHTS